jgi:hypothetical protein
MKCKSFVRNIISCVRNGDARKPSLERFSWVGFKQKCWNGGKRMELKNGEGRKEVNRAAVVNNTD